MEVNANFYNVTGINNATYNQINSRPATGTQTTPDQNTASGKTDQLTLSQEGLQKSQTDNQLNSSNGAKNPDGTKQLSPADKQLIQKLKARDSHVRMHEAAHLSVGGSYIKGGPTYQYQIGPDGKAYAIGGEVTIDASPIPGNPQATIAKEEIVRRAALAPADPSAADIAVAGEASQLEAKAQEELQEKNAAKQNSQVGSNNSPVNQTETNPTTPADETNDDTAGNRLKNMLSQTYQVFSEMLQVGQLINQKA